MGEYPGNISDGVFRRAFVCEGCLACQLAGGRLHPAGFDLPSRLMVKASGYFTIAGEMSPA